MSAFKDFMDKGRKISPLYRAALVAESSEKVFPLYENYWVGNYSEEARKSIDLMWSFASGEKVNVDLMKSYRKELSDLAQFYLNEEEINILSDSISVILYGLNSTIAVDEGESLLGFARSLSKAIEAAISAEYMADQNNPIPGRFNVAEQKEGDWQQSAIDFLIKWKGAINRNMFDSLSDKPYQWFLDWKVRGWTEITSEL